MSDSTSLTPRQQRAAEYILEDEGLTGDLEDSQAQQLVNWAGDAAVRAAAPRQSDAQAEALVAAVRQAARRAARQAAEQGQNVVALAEAALAEFAPTVPGAQPPAPRTPTLRRRIESLRTRLISLISHRTS